METHIRRIYDPRLKNLIKKFQNPYLFPELKIPQSTSRGWLHSNPINFVTSDKFELSNEQLLFENQSLNRQCEQISTKLSLLQTVNDVFDFTIEWKRLPDSISKSKLLDSIETAKKYLPISECLETINISPSRYHIWKRKEQGCELEDYSSCPKTKPSQLTFDEIKKMGNLATSPSHIHFSIKSLALYAMRQGILFASPTTWGKMIKERGWIRPKKRIYPEKPKIGIRANRPNAIWHIDTSIIKLLDGTKAYIQAIIDNYSRYIVAWKITTSINGISTKELLEQALIKTKNFSPPIELISDGGPENDNTEVKSIASTKEISDDDKLIKLSLAQIDIDPSNSMIEYFFRILKHRYLFLKSLDNVSSLTKHSGFFIDQHNNVVPQSVLRGATPAEMYFGTWTKDKEEQLILNHLKSQKARMDYHRSLSCRICSPENIESSSMVDVNTSSKFHNV